MSPRLCVALLALCCLTAASDPDCEELLKPEVELSKIYGKWFYHLGTADGEMRLTGLRTFSSSWLELSPIPGSKDMKLSWNDKTNGSCIYGSTDLTISGDDTDRTFTANIYNETHIGKYLKTCSDCIVWAGKAVGADGAVQGRHLHLFSKNEKVDDADLELLKKQAKCLKFPAEYHEPEVTDWCPAQTEATGQSPPL